MSTKEHFIKSPEELEALASQIYAQDDDSISHHIRLAVFYPLARKETFDQCRDPDSQFSRDPAGNRCGRTDHEYLDVTSLGRSWRQHWKSLPTKISSVTFDMTLPDPDESVPQVRWMFVDSRSEDLKFYMQPQATQLLVETLVLAMHVRSKGSVKMELVCDGKGEEALFKVLRSFIEALETGGRSHRERSLKERSRDP